MRGHLPLILGIHWYSLNQDFCMISLRGHTDLDTPTNPTPIGCHPKGRVTNRAIETHLATLLEAEKYLIIVTN